MDKLTNYSLTPEEVEHLYYWHMSNARYWANCESTQRDLAEKEYDCGGNKKFDFSGPLKGQPITVENWLKRAEIFRKWKDEHRERAKLFVNEQ